jgi:serine protease Do
MNWKQILTIMGISAGTAVGSVMVYSKMTAPKPENNSIQSGKLPANYANYTPMGDGNAPLDFTAASNTAVPAVVHIKTKTKSKTVNASMPKNPFFDDPIFERFFDDGMMGQRFQRTIPEQRASGSGVFISADGYIITNNHVVEGADEVKVTLSNKKTYVAKVIGADPLSDLAVIKVEGSGFPYLVYGNSDEVKLGQWVLAVGYPLTLDCSVTAGIVSAKARSLGLNNERSGPNKPAIESYIQTDAAVNKGNSGGALVNTRGELIGINSAIASPTGFYAGYSYAIPVNIAKKIAADLMKHGSAQRAYLGVRPAFFNEDTDGDGQPDLKDGKGVEIRDVSKGGAASQAGITTGDIITKINGRDILTWNELVEQVASYSVGDKITVTYLRGGKENTASATLKNESGNFDIVTQQSLAQQLGVELENVSAAKAKEYGIEGGVVLKNIVPAGLLKSQNPSIKKGLVIIRVNGNGVNNIEELGKAIEANAKSTVIQGFYPGYEGVYTYVINNVKDDE